MMNKQVESGLHLPAEWHSCEYVMLSWPHEATDWSYMLDEITECYVAMAEAIVPYAKLLILSDDENIPKKQLAHLPESRILYHKYLTNDTWIRDYGPLTLVGSNGVASALADYRFNGWGLKFAACFDNLATSDMGRNEMFSVPLFDRRDFVLEGGGIESDGNGNLMTTATCQLSPNRNPTLTCTDIKERLMHDFGARNVVWIENGFLAGDDTDSHIDTLARFAPDNTIVYTCCNDPSDIHYTQLQAMKRELEQAVGFDGCRFKLVELPFPNPVYDDSGCRLPATYSNYLVLPDAVIMPEYNQTDNDVAAKKILAEVYKRDVVSVDCTALIQQHGSLHCATMQIPFGVINKFDK